MTDKEKLEKLMKLADAMYYAAQNLTTDASRLHKAMDEYHKFIIYEYHKEEPTIPEIVDEHFDEMLGEEPANEDFESALEKKVREAQDWTYIEEEGGECPLNEEFGADDLEEFARWGANWQKQQMMKDAADGVITFDYYKDDKAYGCVAHDSFCLEERGLRDCDKVKIIVVKED